MSYFRTVTCQYCSNIIEDKRLIQEGRPRLYCKRSCRQRAYEHRKQKGIRGAAFDPLPPPESRIAYRPRGTRVERWLKGSTILSSISHAVIPGPIEAGTRFRTLCGLQVLAMPSHFRLDDPLACESCCTLYEKHPPTRFLPDMLDAWAIESRLLELEDQLGMSLNVTTYFGKPTPPIPHEDPR